ncbi:glycyl-tRNA synthetase [Aphelenchoides avenae]|nr:glycyl-tRNA synthetase [Aphelenchus avenae]
MADPEIEKQLKPLREAVKEIGDRVRDLKLQNAPKEQIDEAVRELKARKKKLEEKELACAPKDASFDRHKLEDLLKRRFFFDQSFAIYGGVAGLYDYGPMGCALKSNMVQLWRKHFILEEGMLEVECSALTPERVLKASGHVERFVDWMVKDSQNGECFRADHLIKNFCEARLADKKNPPTDQQKKDLNEGFTPEDMNAVIRKFDIRAPLTGNEVTEPVSFNLMFPTQIGPTGDFKAFLRPETAQGIFINFKRLLEFNQGKLPFAAAQIGAGFRNEISPRQGLIRVREFTMCEIEHFVDPADKAYSKFDKVADIQLSLFTKQNQMQGAEATRMRIGQAVEEGIVDNETLGYYMARTHLYLLQVGVNEQRLRFRQHLDNEMAHYAKDCWDAEILTSYGWIECVGHADRSCYDLDAHAKESCVKLVAEKTLAEPRLVNIVELKADKAKIGKEFKTASKPILTKLGDYTGERAEEVEKELEKNGKFAVEVEGKEYALTKDMVSVVRYEKKLHVEEVVPSVIEPSFGIGRIMYAVLEHSFRQREGDEQRSFLELPPVVASIKCSILPLSGDARFQPLINVVREELAKNEISCKVDDSAGSIGRRYARTDEIGIPFGVTIDFDSLKEPWTVTLRDAPSMQQIRLQVSDLGSVLAGLASGRTQWAQLLDKYPLFTGQEAAATENAN